jgi:NAD(P)-dependent dehydrogenase (short-subunit alcohol dehydrogenase family)
MSQKRIALVTGANKGIGLEIVRQLAAAGLRVVLSARDAARGKEALATVRGDVSFLQMNVADDESIDKAAEEYANRREPLDVLINNAAIYIDDDSNILAVSRSRLMETLQTNTFGAIRVTQAFLPFLKKGARVINLSSGYGEIDGLTSEVPSYCLSKLALNGVTIMLDQALRSRGISVYAMSPGWVRTDMGGPNARRSVEEGADTAVWLATEASAQQSGRYFRDRQVGSW